ncbi:hypothetical protein FE257_010471 [Aspergillus nanangensis]|uniref:Uncharacterized protein n=1 Tax=Aspergillus nanangensis TaxID=2582783 RepID=A0AAD4GS31_ASPNN|nr:hypothetical protein FE257_010471 [Aspergillus nanangensis]
MSHNIHRAKVWSQIPDDLMISQLMQDNFGNTPSDKIIYEEALTGKIATYGSFHRQIRRTAYQLRDQLAFQPGQTVSISAGSCIDYILVAQAVWWAGGVVNPINNSLHPDEIAHALDLVKPSYLVVDESLYAKIPALMKKQSQALQVLTIGPKPSVHWPAFPINYSPSIDDEPELSNPLRLPGATAKDTCAAILLSSGTTGLPKAVMLSHYNLVATCYQLRDDNPANWRGSQREIFFPPLSHVYALYVCFTMCSWLGAYVCLLPRFELETYCRLLQDRKATVARIVPPIAKMLAEHPVVQKYRYPSLEYFSCSAAPLHKETATKLSKAFPGVALCQTYGCTELSGPCVQSGVRDKNLPLNGAGTLVANSELRFLDTDGNDVGARGPGEITCRGPNVMMGYKDNAEETAKAICKDGWLRTGDLGYIDDYGYLTVYDRIKELIKYKGFQVAPSELENILIRHPLVREAAVIGIWSEHETTEIPRAFVVLEEEGSKESAPEKIVSSILDFVAKQVSNYKRLRGGVVIIDALPKNTTGKVLKKELKSKNASFEPIQVPLARL